MKTINKECFNENFVIKFSVNKHTTLITAIIITTFYLGLLIGGIQINQEIYKSTKKAISLGN
jgi:hypothetical protein